MLKKIFLIILGIILFIVIAGGLYIKSLANKFDQVKLQYDNEVISALKSELDFSVYEEALNKIDKERMDQIESFVNEKDIKTIQSYILDKKINCEEVLLYYINRIKLYDPNYNTVISLNPKALEYARALDQKLQRGEDVGSLFGAMILIKDNISDKDMNTTAGSYALKDLKTKRDSFVVKTIKDQDGIIIGKNNLSEWGSYMSVAFSSGFSTLGGQTKNAYGRFDVGGSSSGSAVSTSLDFATVSLGTETAGSVIYPASQNSVVGLKPTLGLLSRDLVIPITEAQDTIGIIGKNVKDVYFMINTLAGYDDNDEATKIINSYVKEDRVIAGLDRIKNQKVFVYDGSMYSEERDQVIKELKSLGVEVELVKLEGEEDGINYMPVMDYGIVHDVEKYLNNPDVVTEFKSLKQILDFGKEDSQARMPYGATLHENALESSMTENEYNDLVLKNKETALQMIDFTFEDKGMDFIVSISNELSGIYAPAGCPAVTVPAGYKKNGEPFGITFVGSLGSDNYLLESAYGYEELIKHRAKPLIKK